MFSRLLFLRAVFAEPIPGVADFDDAAAVGVDVFAAVVRPDVAGADCREAGGSGRCRILRGDVSGWQCKRGGTDESAQDERAERETKGEWIEVVVHDHIILVMGNQQNTASGVSDFLRCV